MTSNPFKYGNVPVKGEGERIVDEAEMTIEDQLAYAVEQLKILRRYRFTYRRLAQIASEGNLMINNPHHGFVLVEDLEQYMGEKV